MTSRPGFVTLPPFRIKTVNADFVVDEVYLEPELSTQSEATYTYLFVEKENITTFFLQRVLADYFNLPLQEVSAAGLKDEEAITRQIISLKRVISDEEISRTNVQLSDQGLAIRVRFRIGYGQKPVYPRMLHGNKFTITIRNLEEAIANDLTAYIGDNKYFSFVNYYDEQRFGPPGSIHNTPVIGQYLLTEDWEEAYQAYLESGNDPDEMERAVATYTQSRSYYEAIMAIMPAKRDFFISSYNSLIWNSQLNQEILRLGPAIQVDLPYLGLLALPAEASAAVPSLFSVSVEKRDWQTGQKVPTIKTRPVLINVPVYLLDQSDDSYHPGRQALIASFYLPTGCYATMLIKQMLLAARTN